MKTELDVDKAKEHIEKAEHDFKVLKFNEEQGYHDWAVNIGFYVIYHCFLAIASKFGYESGNQTCTISLVEWLKEEGKIDLDSKFIKMFRYGGDAEKGDVNKVIEMREKYTYGVKISVDVTKMEELMKNCREMMDVTKGIVYD